MWTFFPADAVSFPLPAPRFDYRERRAAFTTGLPARFQREAGSWKRYAVQTLKLVPHPHVLLALGLLKMKPRLTRLVSYSCVVSSISLLIFGSLYNFVSSGL